MSLSFLHCVLFASEYMAETRMTFAALRCFRNWIDRYPALILHNLIFECCGVQVGIVDLSGNKELFKFTSIFRIIETVERSQASGQRCTGDIFGGIGSLRGLIGADREGSFRDQIEGKILHRLPSDD